MKEYIRNVFVQQIFYREDAKKEEEPKKKESKKEQDIPKKQCDEKKEAPKESFLEGEGTFLKARHHERQLKRHQKKHSMKRKKK